MRFYSALFVLTPLWLIFFSKFGVPYLNKASGAGIWLYFVGLGTMLVLGLWSWAKWVPAAVSWVLGAVIWIAVVALAFAGKILSGA